MSPAVFPEFLKLWGRATDHPQITRNLWERCPCTQTQTLRTRAGFGVRVFLIYRGRRRVPQSGTLFTTQRSRRRWWNLPEIPFTVLKKRSRPGIPAKNIRGRGKTVEDREFQMRSISSSWKKLEYSLPHILQNSWYNLFFKGTHSNYMIRKRLFPSQLFPRGL